MPFQIRFRVLSCSHPKNLAGLLVRADGSIIEYREGVKRGYFDFFLAAFLRSSASGVIVMSWSVKWVV